jgi:hypothetical protein
LSVVQGSGVDLSDRHPEKQGDRYAQVCLLYGIPNGEVNRLLPEKAATRDAQHYERSLADGRMEYPSAELGDDTTAVHDQVSDPGPATMASGK